MIDLSKIKQAVESHLPGAIVTKVFDRGQWVRRIYQVELSNGETVFLKVITNPDWAELKHEANVVDMMIKHDLTAPKVLTMDNTGHLIDFPFLIQEQVGGEKLSDLLHKVSSTEKQQIYKAIGKFYRKMHQIRGIKSGLWDVKDPYKVKYEISPNNYMLQAEIIEGSGRKALASGLISKSLYQQIVDIWQQNIEYLNDHQPVMTHVSPFLWNIYLGKCDQKWQVTKIMSMGDVMWWDSAYDLATLKYPPFGAYDEASWQSFLESYNSVPEEKRLLLYSLMHQLCAAMGVYMEPQMYKTADSYQNIASRLAQIVEQITN